MTILYILTSEGNDVFIDMTYISASLVKFNHPAARIIIAVDHITNDNLQVCKHPLLNICDEIKVCNTPEGKPNYRNRYVKCRMRQLISGDFLYLDADTLPVRPIEDIFKIDKDFAAASNHSLPYNLNFISYEKEMFSAFTWPVPEQNYINGGVLFWKDNPETHRLSDLYIEKWTQSNKAGFHYDQPALNAALNEWNGSFQILDNKFNAQYTMNFPVSVDAHIWHSYFSEPEQYSNDFFRMGIEAINDDSKFKSFIKTITQARIPIFIKSKRETLNIIKKVKENDLRYKKVLEIVSANFYLNMKQEVIKKRNRVKNIVHRILLKIIKISSYKH